MLSQLYGENTHIAWAKQHLFDYFQSMQLKQL